MMPCSRSSAGCVLKRGRSPHGRQARGAWPLTRDRPWSVGTNIGSEELDRNRRTSGVDPRGRRKRPPLRRFEGVSARSLCNAPLLTRPAAGRRRAPHFRVLSAEETGPSGRAARRQDSARPLKNLDVHRCAALQASKRPGFSMARSTARRSKPMSRRFWPPRFSRAIR